MRNYSTAEDTAAPQVTVVIPAYNAAATVVRAIESVRAQQGVIAEIIVIDDGSADATHAVVHAHIKGLHFAKLLKMPKNSGVSAARNAGIQAASSTYLAFLDADDVWHPGKLASQLARIAADPDITLVSCNSRLLAPDGTTLKEGHVNRPPVEGADAWKRLLTYNFIPTPTVLTRTALVRECGGFNEAMAVGEDLDLWIKLATRGKVAVLPEIFVSYYDTADSLMKRHSGHTGGIVAPMLEQHIKEQCHRLSNGEIRHIRGYQAFQMGCDLFFSGNHMQSIPQFTKAASHGARPLKSLLYIPRALLMRLVHRERRSSTR
ncbi:MAG TPA: glycosyltransferase family A protein [Telluria sp.]